MTERLELRIDKDVKSILIKATDILQLDLTTFVINSATVKALEFLKSHQEILNVIKHDSVIMNELRKQNDTTTIRARP